MPSSRILKNLPDRLLKNIGTFAISAGTIGCFATQVQAATFKASIDNFSLLMPAAIENQFGFTLSTGNEKGTRAGAAGSTGNAKANFKLFEFQQSQQPSGLPNPPFSDVRVGRKGSAGSVEGFANPTGVALANTQAVLFGRLGNGTGLPGFPPAKDIPLTIDLSFNYDLSAVANLALENASAAYEVNVTGLGTPDCNSPLSWSIVANDAKAGKVTCTFSTILKGSEFRDFNIQLKVAGAAEAKDQPPPPPPPPPPIPPDIKIPEPTSTLSLLALGIIGAASTIKRKQK